MAHFAKIGVGNEVIELHTLSNKVLMKDGIENEQQGVEFLQNLFGSRDLYVQSSYNNNFRKNHAGIGYTFDTSRDAFIPPKPYLSWVLNDGTCLWDAPTAMPDDGKYYTWNEDTQAWDEVPE